jgi:hypothetical protein
MLRNGDCLSWTSSASLRVPSNTGSPVVFVTSASTTESRSLNARVRLEYSNDPATAIPATVTAAAAHAHALRFCVAIGAAATLAVAADTTPDSLDL